MTSNVTCVGAKASGFFAVRHSRNFVLQLIRQRREQRFGNGMLAFQPFAEVNQLAAFGAKQPIFSGRRGK
jgi:hypothetical protein